MNLGGLHCRLVTQDTNSIIHSGLQRYTHLLQLFRNSMSHPGEKEKPLLTSKSGAYVHPFGPAHRQTVGVKNYISEQQRKENFDAFIRKYEISNHFADRLFRLNGFEIVFVCDDSDSMKNSLNSLSTGYSQQITRWDELKNILSIIIDLAATLDPDGVDVYFLNREPMLNVCSSQELDVTFPLSPEGTTQIVRILKRILRDKQAKIEENKLLLIIATDGAPTDDQGNEQIDQFREFLMKERREVYDIPATIIACTDDTNAMSYLNDWDREIPHLDVVSDYQNEKKKILDVQGKTFRFTFGDYVLKTMLGGIDDWFDKLDEEKIFMPDHR